MHTIRIQNFQSIKDLTIEVDGFTTLEGKSDIGKSAIQRAINFALYNIWKKNYVRNGEKDVEIDISSNKFNIKRIKGKSNITHVNGVVYEKSGSVIPPEFAQFGIKNLTTVDNEYNIVVSRQLDRLFLTSFPEAEQHKVLNSVLETAKYEEALRFVNADINVISKKSSDLFANISESEHKISGISKIISILENIQDSQVKSSNIINFVNLNNTLSEVEPTLLSYNSTIGLINKFELLTKYVPLDEKLQNSKNLHGSTEKTLKDVSSYINVTKYVDNSLREQEMLSAYNSMSSALNNMNLLIFANMNSGRETLTAKLCKAEKINAHFDSVISLTEQLELIKSYAIDDKREQYMISFLNDLTDSIGNYIAIDAIVSAVDRKNTLDTSISINSKQLEEVNEEIANFVHECKDSTCPTCGQILPKGVVL